MVVLGADEEVAIEGRRLGFELRDALLLLWPQTTSFAFLFRTPMSEATAVDQIAGTQTGALNVEVCRIQGGIKQATAGRRTIRWGVGMGGCSYEKGTGAIFTNEGRWPTNVVLIHGPSCRLIGETKIDGHKGYPNGPGGSSSQFSQKGTATNRKEAWAGHADADGKETIPLWECQDDCPARLLDGQSGVRKSGGGDKHGRKASGFCASTDWESFKGTSVGGDSGGASRFYPQFASPWELLDWFRALVSVPGQDLLEEV